MKKLTGALALALCLVCMVLAGCGSAEAPAVSSPAPTAAPEVTPTPTPELTATPEPTPEPTPDPNDMLAFSTTQVELTRHAQYVEIYCGTTPIENISWFSDDESVAMFSRGCVIATGIGSTTVHARYRNQTLSCQVSCTMDDDEHMIEERLLRAPRLAPPIVEDMEDSSFFSDAIFMGDSVSYVLQGWHEKTGCFGEAIFMTRSSMGLENTLDGRIGIYFQGENLSPEEAISRTDAKKLFIMLGHNDLGLYGVDGTMERWREFVLRIKDKNPELQLYIQSCTPISWVGQFDNFNNDLIEQLNAELEAFCQEQGFEYVDIAPWFRDLSNGMADVYSSDKYVHINYDGAALWERVLKAYAAEQSQGE